MPNLQDIVDVFQWWGADLTLSPTGGLAQVSLVDRSRQRVMRRLMTNPGDYLFEPTYGAGCGRFVGANLNLGLIKSTIAGQMQLEATVDSTAPITVNVAQIPNGVQVDIAYTVAPEKVPAVLSFSVTP